MPLSGFYSIKPGHIIQKELWKVRPQIQGSYPDRSHCHTGIRTPTISELEILPQTAGSDRVLS
jgi:hypothetical protein